MEGFVKDELESNLMPTRVAKPYKRCGWSTFTFLVVLFIVGAAVFITLKFKARDNPAVAFSVEKEKNLEFPKKLIICPDSPKNISWHYFDFIDNDNVEFKNENAHPEIEVAHMEDLDLDCITLALNAKVLQTPVLL
jgi:hypothetical protein